MDTIDFDDYSTITNNIKSYVLANKGDFIKESESNTVDRYGLSVSYNDEIIREHKIHLNEILCHYCFLGGHYTKVIDLEDIDTGLKVLDFMDMFYKLQKQLIKAGFQDRDELLRFEQYMYDERIKRIRIIFIFQEQLNTETCCTEQYKANGVSPAERNFKKQHGQQWAAQPNMSSTAASAEWTTSTRS